VLTVCNLGWRGEQYAVYGPGKPPHAHVAFTLERSACALFGLATFGVHLTVRWKRRRS